MKFEITLQKTEVSTSTGRHLEAPPSQPQQSCCPIVELRQYTLHPGKRDVLIELFDREFIESQEALGMKVIGQFRDLYDPNRFVWLRGFEDMPSRTQALTEFYTGPVWKTHREEANATMIDSDNVLLLHPARPESGFLLGTARPSFGSNEVSAALVVATIYYLDEQTGDDFVDFFERMLKPALIDSGVSILAYLETDSSKNNFPALPVREGENVFIWFSLFRDQTAHEEHCAALSKSPRWHGEVSQKLQRRLKKPPEVLKLSPTARSQLRG
jgi:hypothetical protein